jgi:hypothetical protein
MGRVLAGDQHLGKSALLCGDGALDVIVFQKQLLLFAGRIVCRFDSCVC